MLLNDVQLIRLCVHGFQLVLIDCSMLFTWFLTVLNTDAQQVLDEVQQMLNDVHWFLIIFNPCVYHNQMVLTHVQHMSNWCAVDCIIRSMTIQ